MVKVLPLFLLVACGGAAEDADPYLPPDIVTAELAPAVTGESYATWLEVEGGEAPLRWTITGELPAGLVFNPAGAISGMPAQVADATVTVEVTDDRGRSDSAELSLSVALALDALPCGGDLSGEFDEAAMGDRYAPDLDASGGYTWLQIPLPTDDTTRIELFFEPESVDAYYELYLAQPGTPSGDLDFEQNYRLSYGYPGSPLVIDLDTFPDLDTYKSYAAPLQVLVVAERAGTWAVQSECSNGPIFTDLAFVPTRIGEELAVNFNVHGDGNGETTIWTDDPLPDWVVWDETTGRLSGTAGETGVFGFTVQAEDAEGRHRSEYAYFGVYEVHELGCDEPFVWTPTEGFYDGVEYVWYDPTGYEVFHLDDDLAWSAVGANLTGIGSGEVGFSSAGGLSYFIDGPSDSNWGGSGELAAEVSPLSFPGIGQYRDVEEGYYVQAYGYYGSSDEASFWFSCDPAPRPDVNALPVLDPGGAESWDFGVAGGTPPYTWAAAGLPDGVTLDVDGRLQSDDPAAGSAEVDITVVDADGLQSDTPYTLYVGDDAACLGVPRLSCGDTVAGAFTARFYESFPDGAASYCMGSDTAEYSFVTFSLTAGAEAELSLALHHPGHADAQDALYGGDYSSMAWAEQGDVVAGLIDESTYPALQTYLDQPVFLSVAAYEAGDWELTVSCE